MIKNNAIKNTIIWQGNRMHLFIFFYTQDKDMTLFSESSQSLAVFISKYQFNYFILIQLVISLQF